jgi:hypothetical protein
MLGVRLLPWDYGVRNVFRRPVRSALALATLTLVILLVLVVVGFVRGLEAALAVSGDPRVVLVHAAGASENVENSSVPARTTGLLTASLPGVQRRTGPGGTQVPYASPDLFLGTQVAAAGLDEPSMGLVRRGHAGRRTGAEQGADHRGPLAAARRDARRGAGRQAGRGEARP